MRLLGVVLVAVRTVPPPPVPPLPLPPPADAPTDGVTEVTRIGPGSKTTLMRANWPEPPLCFLWV